MKYLFLIIFLNVTFFGVFAQHFSPQNPDYTFKNYQYSFDRVQAASQRFEKEIKNQIEKKGLKYPCTNLLFRAFKGSNELELWGRNTIQDTFVLIKNYKICALSGILGPKRWEGDRQVPEGFYFLNEFKPNSEYHLSMLVNYPNYSDLIAGNKQHPGGDIYVHGACMTVGCLPMTNEWIEEIYIFALQARINGQMNIPIHVFPLRYTQKGLDFLGKEYKNEKVKHEFWVNIKRSYDYFEATHKILPVMYDESGNYAF
ncbi:MAG: hypothetical protein R2831_07610 [Chitinophagaceae bacterium]